MSLSTGDKKRRCLAPSADILGSRLSATNHEAEGRHGKVAKPDLQPYRCSNALSGKTLQASCDGIRIDGRCVDAAWMLRNILG